MAGKLILISGVSGAGKTTLIRAVLTILPTLEYLHTVTTRSQRPDETDSLEYQFVTDDVYETLRAHSAKWDHTAYHGYKYGADAEWACDLLKNGVTVLCSVAPDLKIIADMAKLYEVTPVTVWIDTPTNVANVRVAHDGVRSQRSEDESIKAMFDHIFTPSGELTRDKAAFTRMVQHRII